MGDVISVNIKRIRHPGVRARVLAVFARGKTLTCNGTAVAIGYVKSNDVVRAVLTALVSEGAIEIANAGFKPIYYRAREEHRACG